MGRWEEEGHEQGYFVRELEEAMSKPKPESEQSVEEQQEQAMCAHIRVSWCTESQTDGTTRGWWWCQLCHAEFVPQSTIDSALERAAQYVTHAEQTGDSLREDLAEGIRALKGPKP